MTMNRRYADHSSAHRNRGILLLGLPILGLFAFGLMLVATDPGDNLVVIESELETDRSGRRVVRGVVQNRTGRAFSRVRVRVDLLDEADRVIGNVEVVRDTLASGES